MPDFIVPLEQMALKKQRQLRPLFSDEFRDEEERLRRLFLDGQHWHPLPEYRTQCIHAVAVDGGSRRLELANGSLLVIAQALLLGENIEDAIVDLEVVRGSVPRTTADRFADLFLHRLEIQLAAKHVQQVGGGGMVLLDGALYGALPQLYPLRVDALDDLTRSLTADLQTLFEACGQGSTVVSIAKSSRESVLAHLLQLQAGTPAEAELKIPDSEMIYRWTEQSAGFSTPVLLGTHCFTEGSSRALLEPPASVARMPAIVSFFLRPEAFTPAWRVDVPGICVGRTERIGDLEVGWTGPDQVEPLAATLLADYGGPQVYHALLYAVDHEVRLSTERLLEVYLPILAETWHVPLMPTLSSARFLE